MKPIGQIVSGHFEPISVLIRFFNQLTVSVSHTVADSRFIFQSTGKIRRFWLVHFRKRYVQARMLARSGHCRQCGTCCSLLFTCPVLSKQGRCFAYGACRPRSCKIFPIDQRDINEVRLCGGRCGYHFEEETPHGREG